MPTLKKFLEDRKKNQKKIDKQQREELKKREAETSKDYSSPLWDQVGAPHHIGPYRGRG